MMQELPITFPEAPSLGQARNRPRDDVHLVAPLAVERSAFIFSALFTVGDTDVPLPDDLPCQRPLVWVRVDGSKNGDFDFSLFGLFLAGFELRIHKGLAVVGKDHTRVRDRIKVRKLERGDRLWVVVSVAPNGMVTVSGSVKGPESASQAWSYPAFAPILVDWSSFTEINVGMSREYDFPNGPKEPGNWQPLYSWTLNDLSYQSGGVPPTPPPTPPPVDLPPKPPKGPQSEDPARVALRRIAEIAQAALSA